MNLFIHIIFTIITALITIDIILMVMNGTMLLLMGFWATIYISFWLIFGRSPYHLIKHWIMNGAPQNNKEKIDTYEKSNQINHAATRQIF